MLQKTIQGESTLMQRPWAEERHGGERGSEPGCLDWCGSEPGCLDWCELGRDGALQSGHRQLKHWSAAQTLPLSPVREGLDVPLSLKSQ